MAEGTAQRQGREGGRWINQRPAPEEFAQWFKDSMKIDGALKVEDYIGGVVLIPAVDGKVPYVKGLDQNGAPVIERREELVFTPYAKVESRIDYFWDLLEVHEDWVGVVERVTPNRMPIDFVHTTERREASDHSWTSRELRSPTALTSMEHRLPEGFSIFTVPVASGYSHYLVCTIRVAIYNREEYMADRAKAVPRRKGQGSKQVALTKSSYNGDRVWADDSSLMKAETGALGRALGFAGIFVIPGSGVATAEDMIESMTQGTTPTSEQADQSGHGPAAPTEAPVKTGAEQSEDEQAQLAARAKVLFESLKEDHPEKADEFGRWAHQRHITRLSDAKGATLRGIVSRLEKLSAEAEESSQQAPPEEPDVKPSETTEEGSDGEPSGAAG